MGANNGIFYLSRRLGETIAGTQQRILDQAGGAGDKPEAMLALLQEWSGQQAPLYSAMIFRNTHSGIHMHGVTSSAGREMVTSFPIAPLGMMAAIALPSFVKARTAARQNACINNLRMLDAAKEQWSLANKIQPGAEPDHRGVMEYIRGGEVTCPQGGAYTLNVIGPSPACSIHGDLQTFYGR